MYSTSTLYNIHDAADVTQASDQLTGSTFSSTSSRRFRFTLSLVLLLLAAPHLFKLNKPRQSCHGNSCDRTDGLDCRCTDDCGGDEGQGTTAYQKAPDENDEHDPAGYRLVRHVFLPSIAIGGLLMLASLRSDIYAILCDFIVFLWPCSTSAAAVTAVAVELNGAADPKPQIV